MTDRSPPVGAPAQKARTPPAPNHVLVEQVAGGHDIPKRVLKDKPMMVRASQEGWGQPIRLRIHPFSANEVRTLLPRICPEALKAHGFLLETDDSVDVSASRRLTVKTTPNFTAQGRGEKLFIRHVAELLEYLVTTDPKWQKQLRTLMIRGEMSDVVDVNVETQVDARRKIALAMVGFVIQADGGCFEILDSKDFRDLMKEYARETRRRR